MMKNILAFWLIGFAALLLPLSAQESAKAPWPWAKTEQVLLIATGPGNPRNSEGDFVALKNGDILYIYTHYDGDSGDDHASAHLASRRSSDGGKTWTAEDKLEIPNEGKLNVMSVTCRRLTDGRIMLLYLVKENPGDCRPYLRFSDDETQTWSERICAIAEPSYNVVNNDRAIQLASGRLLIPVACHAFQGGDQYNYDGNADTFCLISDDGGATWTRGASVAKTPGAVYQEPGVCELSDGRILMNIRSDAGHQIFAYSEAHQAASGERRFNRGRKSALGESRRRRQSVRYDRRTPDAGRRKSAGAQNARTSGKRMGRLAISGDSLRRRPFGPHRLFLLERRRPNLPNEP